MIATQRFRKLVFLVDLIVYTLPYYIYPTALCQVKYNYVQLNPCSILSLPSVILSQKLTASFQISNHDGSKGLNPGDLRRATCGYPWPTPDSAAEQRSQQPQLLPLRHKP